MDVTVMIPAAIAASRLLVVSASMKAYFVRNP